MLALSRGPLTEMCGIFGSLSPRRMVPEEAVARALTSLSHRGPDGEGVWNRTGDAPSVLFGHRRLAILDLSEAAAQPMRSVDGRLTVVFNGEIYNFRELRDKLQSKGHSFSSSGDTEVLLACYREWGNECTQYLNGMFAFAIWDEAKKILFSARDRFGEKPFFYYLSQDGSWFSFASEMKALRAAGVRLDLHDEAIARYVSNEAIDAEHSTFLRGITRLPPGHQLRLRWRQGRWEMNIRRYWVLPAEVRDIGLTEAGKELRDLLEDSVRLRLRADVPVGTSLSGGIDSSSVVCLIKRIGADAGQRTFSARMSDPRLDEGRYIKAVLSHVNVEAWEVVPTAERLAQSFERLCWFMEEPFPATSMFAQYLVMELASRHGTTVLLDGQGADELFAGYMGYVGVRLRELLRGGHVASALRERSAFAARQGGRPPMSLKGVFATYLPASVREQMLAGSRKTGFDSWWSHEWMAGSMATGEDQRHDQSMSGPSLDALLRKDALLGPLQALLRYGDRNSMAWSREVRQPFLDHRLAEFAFSIPPECKIGNGETKRVLREAMRGVVPDMILDRHDKLGYQAPLSEWLSGALKEWVIGKLEQAETTLSGRLAPGAVDRFNKLSCPISEWGDARYLMRILTMAEGIEQLKAAGSRVDPPSAL